MLFRIEFSIKFPKKIMSNMKIKKKLSWPYGEFSNIKSSNSNPMDDFENFFIAISILRENAAPFSERLAQFQY